MSGIILPGGGTSVEHESEDDDRSDGRRVNVTNFLSFGHLVPWGGTLDVRRLSVSEVKDRFKDKRVDLFAFPDVEMIGEMVRSEAMATGRMPQGSVEEREEAYCVMVEQAVKQMTECHVRRVQKPKPAANDRRTFFIQFFPQPQAVVGTGMQLGSVWWEIVTKGLRQKPVAAAEAKVSS